MKEETIADLEEVKKYYNNLSFLINNQIASGKIWLGRGNDRAIARLEKIGEYDNRSSIEIIQGKIEHLNNALNLVDDLENALAAYVAQKEDYINSTNKLTKAVNKRQMIEKQQKVREIYNTIRKYLSWI